MYTMLPDLPKVLKKREATVTPRVLKWVKEHVSDSCGIEIKATSTRSIPASALADHQRLALKTVKGDGLVWKITDEARRQQPFDAFKVKGHGYVVACFTGPGDRTCLVIDVDEWQGARADMKSGYVARFPL